LSAFFYFLRGFTGVVANVGWRFGENLTIDAALPALLRTLVGGLAKI